MKLFFFDAVVTLVYVAGLIRLIRELRQSTPEQQREFQTIPLLLSSTLLFGVVILKTHHLMRLFTGV